MALSDEDVAALAKGIFPDDPALPFWSSDIGPLRYYVKLLAAEVQRLRAENAYLCAQIDQPRTTHGTARKIPIE